MKDHVDHIGIIVRSLDDRVPFYTDALRFEAYTSKSWRVRTQRSLSYLVVD